MLGWLSQAFGRYLPRSTSAYGAVGTRRPRWRKNAMYSTGGPNAELVYDLPELRAVCRDLYYNTTDAKTAVNTYVSFVIGRGQKLQTAFKRDRLLPFLLEQGLTIEEADEYLEIKANEIENRWREWSESKHCDALRQSNYGTIQRLAYKSRLHTGEIFVYLNYEQNADGGYDLSLGMIEADRVTSFGMGLTEQNIDGLLLDERGRPKAINVRRSRDNVSNRECDPVEFYDEAGRLRVIHLFEPERPGQMRGVPFYASSIKTFAQLDALRENEIRAGVVNSYFASIIESNDTNFLESLSDAQRAEYYHEKNSRSAQDLNLENGSLLQLYDGEKFVPVDPKRPNVNYGKFADDLRREHAMSLDMGIEIYQKTFGSSFSASRGTLNMFKKPVSAQAEQFELDFNAPIYREWLRNEVTFNGLDLAGFFSVKGLASAWSGSSFSYEPMGQIDEVKEAEAAKARIMLGISDATQEAAAITGNDYPTIIQNQAREKRLREKFGVKSSTDAEAQPQKPLTPDVPENGAAAE